MYIYIFQVEGYKIGYNLIIKHGESRLKLYPYLIKNEKQAELFKGLDSYFYDVFLNYILEIYIFSENMDQSFGGNSFVQIDKM